MNNTPKIIKICSTCLIIFLIPVILVVAFVVSLVYFPQIYFPQKGKLSLTETEIERMRYGKSIERFSEIFGNQPCIKQFIKSKSYISPPSPSFSPEGNKVLLIVKGEKEDEIQVWYLQHKKETHKCNISSGWKYIDIHWGKNNILVEECNRWEYYDDTHILNYCAASTIKLVNFSTCETEEIVNPNSKVNLNENTLFSKDLRYLAKWNCDSTDKTEKCSYDIIDRADNMNIIWSFKDIPEILNASFSEKNRYLGLITHKKIVLFDLQLLKINSVDSEKLFTYGEFQMSFSPDNNLLAVFSRGIFSVPELVKVSSLFEKLSWGENARFSSDSSQIIISKCSISYVDVKTGKKLKEIIMPEVKAPAAKNSRSPNLWEGCDYSGISNDGRYMLKRTCHNYEMDSDCMCKSFHYWDITENAMPKSLWDIQPDNAVFSPDNKYIAIPFEGGIGIWELGMRKKG